MVNSLLVEKVVGGATGELVAVHESLEVHVFLQRGGVAWGTTTADRYLFRRYLQKVFGVERELLKSIVDDCFRHRRPLGEALINSGVLTRTQVREALACQARASVRALPLCSGGSHLFLERSSTSFASYDPALTFTLEELDDAPDEPSLDTPIPTEFAQWLAWQRLAPRVLLRSGASRSGLFQGKTVVVDESRKLIHELNDTGAFIWHQVDGLRSVEDIARVALTAYPTLAPEFIRGELVQFIEQALEQDIVCLAED